MRWQFLIVVASPALLIGEPAEAFCYYNGKFNVQTTIKQEFRDSKWVVRARVLSAFDCWGEGDCKDPDAPYTVYRIRVMHRYKGNPPNLLKFFTSRDSGGFYLDRAGDLPAAHNIGRDYLLFLNPTRSFKGEPGAEKGSVFVNYNCGRSKLWSEVTEKSRRQLFSLQRTHFPNT